MWAGEPPRAAHGALHPTSPGCAGARARPVLRRRGAASVLETTDHGYLLRVPEPAVDAHAFAAEVRAVDRALAPLSSQFDRPRRGLAGPGRRAADRPRRRGARPWSGEPYADLPDHPDVVADRAALEQLRVAAEESRLIGLLALGEHASVLLGHRGGDRAARCGSGSGRSMRWP